MNKRSFTFIFVLIAVSLGLTAQSITVGHPNPGERWQIGSDQTITWSTTGITRGLFKITLWRGGSQVGVIATDLPVATRSYSWSVAGFTDGSSAPAGTGYTVKVKLKEEPVADESDGPFEITRASTGSAAVIRVTAPNGGEQWNQSGRQNITWTASSIPAGGQFKITLWRGGSQVGVIATDLPAATRSFDWTVGNLLHASAAEPGTGYTVRVKLKDEPTADDSDRPFEIKSGLVVGTLFTIGQRDYEVESLEFRDFNNNPVFSINGVLEFPYSGQRTNGTAIVRVKEHTGLTTAICRPQLVVALRLLSTREEPQQRTYSLTFNDEHIAEIRAPFSVRAGLPGDSDINVQAYLTSMSEGCDHDRTNNSKAWNLNLHMFGVDLRAQIDRFEVKKMYANPYYRWHFTFRIAVRATGVQTMDNVVVRWRLLEDGSMPVAEDTHTIDHIAPGEFKYWSVDKKFGGDDRGRGQKRPLLKAGHRYVVEAMVDPGNSVDEILETNNTHTRSVTLPD